MNQAFWTRLKASLLDSWHSFIDEIPSILLAIVIITVGFLLTRLITNGFRKAINKSVNDPLMTNFLTKTIKIALSIIVILFALKTVGLEGVAAGILTTAGASAIIIGFAFKDVGENFISGVILSFNRPFNVNDTVSIGDIFGQVKTMEFRYTKLKTFDGRDVYIPNSDIIKKSVFNYTEDGYYRLDFVVGISYEDDVYQAESLILEAIRKVEGVIEDDTHEAFVTIDQLAASTVNLKVFFWVKTLEYRKQAHQIKSDAIRKVKQVIETAGISMPADIREIKLYNSQKEWPVYLKRDQH